MKITLDKLSPMGIFNKMESRNIVKSHWYWYKKPQFFIRCVVKRNGFFFYLMVYRSVKCRIICDFELVMILGWYCYQDMSDVIWFILTSIDLFLGSFLWCVYAETFAYFRCKRHGYFKQIDLPRPNIQLNRYFEVLSNNIF